MLGFVAATGAIDYLTDPNLLLNTLLAQLGGWMVAAVALIVFIESGVLFPVLPGDSMIFALGILHNRIPGVPEWLTFLVLFVAAICGNLVGYWLGRKYGRRLFKDDARYLSTENMHKSEEFFRRYGGVALLLARFVPFVRTFVPIIAGLGKQHYRTFLIWNMLGAALWIGVFMIAGVLLGDIPAVANNVEIIAIAIVAISVLPMVVSYFKARSKKKTADK
ncbi:DedA family protein [uncultured Varibaculum sp.]|uniref:DedA family protein n=1 Tax=uncultured Varibaculum sp. TaxID=413896 RepID=UPI0025925060|nr:DedA family protein [uncultured Varibaculum sp.]